MSKIVRDQLVKNVTTAGTQVPLSASSLGFAEVIIQAKVTNTGYIYIGDLGVDYTYLALSAGSTVDLDGGDFKDIYIDSDVNGEGVTCFYRKV
jgi:hypothetical protein